MSTSDVLLVTLVLMPGNIDVSHVSFYLFSYFLNLSRYTCVTEVKESLFLVRFCIEFFLVIRLWVILVEP